MTSLKHLNPHIWHDEILSQKAHDGGVGSGLRGRVEAAVCPQLWWTILWPGTWDFTPTGCDLDSTTHYNNIFGAYLPWKLCWFSMIGIGTVSASGSLFSNSVELLRFSVWSCQRYSVGPWRTPGPLGFLLHSRHLKKFVIFQTLSSFPTSILVVKLKHTTILKEGKVVPLMSYWIFFASILQRFLNLCPWGKYVCVVFLLLFLYQGKSDTTNWVAFHLFSIFTA